MNPTPEQIEKLPKWAQEHIKDLERERFVSIRSLNEAVDKSTPSPFYYEDNVCTGEKSGPSNKRFYIQTHKITIEHAGVELTVLIRDNEDEIDVHWGSSERVMGGVAMRPYSYNSIRLVSKENMR